MPKISENSSLHDIDSHLYPPQRDNTIANLLFSSLFQAIFSQMDQVKTERQMEELTKQINQSMDAIFSQSVLYFPPFIGCILVISERPSILVFKSIILKPRLLESAGILPFCCQERHDDDSPGWQQSRPTAVGWAGGWECAVTDQLSDSVRRR